MNCLLRMVSMQIFITVNLLMKKLLLKVKKDYLKLSSLFILINFMILLLLRLHIQL